MPSFAFRKQPSPGEHVVRGEAREDDGLDVLGLPAGLVEGPARGPVGHLGAAQAGLGTQWRSWIPVRWTIHSSVVSMYFVSSALVTTRSGT